MAALVLLALAGSALRIAAAFDQFWLDEVWSWSLAQRARSWLDVLTLAHDNNHQLNTLWIHVLGPESDADDAGRDALEEREPSLRGAHQPR